jgi:hypothetical protein
MVFLVTSYILDDEERSRSMFGRGRGFESHAGRGEGLQPQTSSGYDATYADYALRPEIPLTIANSQQSKRIQQQRNSQEYRDSITSTGYSRPEVEAYRKHHNIRRLAEARNRLLAMSDEERVKAMADFVKKDRGSNQHRQRNRTSAHRQRETQPPTHDPRHESDDWPQQPYGADRPSSYQEATTASGYRYGQGDMPPQEYAPPGFGRGGFESYTESGGGSRPQPSEYDATRSDFIPPGPKILLAESRQERQRKQGQIVNRTFRDSIKSTGYSVPEVEAYGIHNKIALSAARDELLAMNKDERAKAMKTFVKRGRGGDSASAQPPTHDPRHESADWQPYGREDMSSQEHPSTAGMPTLAELMGLRIEEMRGRG